MKQTEHNGSQLAIEPSADAVARPTLTTIDDLLRLVPKRPGGGGHGPALHSATANFLNFIGATAQETPIYLLETKLEPWVRHLEVARYKKETVKSYRYCVNLLVKTAREHGWEPPSAVMPPSWAPVFDLASGKEVKSIVRFAVLIGKTPSTFTEDDLRSWSQQRIQTGRSLAGCKRHISSFRSLLSMPELSYLRPLVQAKPKGYGVPLREMHSGLRSEIEGLVAYLTDDFELDRNGPPIRNASAEDLLSIVVRLTGFVQNVRGNPPIESLAALLTAENVGGYIKWAIKERKVQGESLVTGLARVHSSLKNHPKYAGLDLNWLPGIIKKLPRSSQSEVDRRKEKKYISYDLADAIPGKIRTARNRAKNPSPSDLAASLRDELMMLWLVILPWRQRNLRECRISGGPHRNLFCEPIQKLSAWTRPKWLEQQEKVDATKPVWQIYFSSSETKSGNEVSAFLPKELVVLLEEYLSHRSALLPANQPDPGTLFLTNKGNAMDDFTIRNRIEELTSRYAGVAVNPHLFRDIVAYEWLKAHPEDFLTLSKLLWHKSVEFTLNIYGSRFNESTGIARMDDWRSRGRKAA
jgi:integrase